MHLVVLCYAVLSQQITSICDHPEDKQPLTAESSHSLRNSTSKKANVIMLSHQNNIKLEDNNN